MKTELLRTEIVKTAKETGKTEIEIITAMQGICAKRKDEETIKVLCEIKNEYIDKLYNF